MRTSYHFFLRYAGYSYDLLANAEAIFMQAFFVSNVGIEWSDDFDGWQDLKYDKVSGYRTGLKEPKSIESARIWHDDESLGVRYLESLYGIEDADENCRRVIRAELALNCKEELLQIIFKRSSAFEDADVKCLRLIELSKGA
jgi:hypothetical protein